MLYCSLFAASLLLGACSASSSKTAKQKTSRTQIINVSDFDRAGLVQDPETVPCILENEATAECLEVVVNYKPESLTVGPFCPVTLDDAGGIWHWTGQDAGLYRVDGEFFQFLDDLGYRFFDDLGNVYHSDISKAQPIQDHTCIHVSPDTSVKMTMLLPLNPVVANSPAKLGTVNKVGLALNGTPIFSDAPSIQHTGHMPALDTCGGHIDPGGWYHWHANSKDIDAVFDHEHVEAKCGLAQDSAALFGYAFDGFPIYGSVDLDSRAPTDLDDCGGHIGPIAANNVSYHYHTPNEFPNLPKCLIGVQARGNFSTTAQAGIGASRENRESGSRNEPPGGGRGRGAPPGFSDAAKKLGVSEDALMQAVISSGGRQLDFAKAAATLNVTEAELRSALPPPPDRR